MSRRIAATPMFDDATTRRSRRDSHDTYAPYVVRSGLRRYADRRWPVSAVLGLALLFILGCVAALEIAQAIPGGP